MPKILILHGLGINMRGKVQTATFGTETMADYNAFITKCADELGVEIEIFHSNIEGEVINKIYAAHDAGDVDAALFNPAAYSGGHPGIVAAIAQVDFPFYEIHISNPAARGGIVPSRRSIARRSNRLRAVRLLSRNERRPRSAGLKFLPP